MSDNTTIARPYAKAIFEYAEEVNQLQDWSTLLHKIAEVIENKEVRSFIDNPVTTQEQQTKLLFSVLENIDSKHAATPAVDNFIKLLAQNKRLNILADIYVQFEALRAELEKTLSVKVISYSELTSAQEKNLIQSLSERLHRQITLDVCIDKALLGGAIIYAGDLVIDGSVRGRLNKLNTELAA